MTDTRLTKSVLADLVDFTKVTAEAWVDAQLVKENSYGVELLVAPNPGANFEGASNYNFANTLNGAEHDHQWYLANAHGKNLICLETGMDSHEAVRLWQGLVKQIRGAFPWGGAVIDPAYGLIVGTSGFKEDEDILFSRTIRNRLVMLLDREGDDVIDDTRQGSYRFTTVVHE